MRLTISLILIAAAALVGGAYLDVARSAERVCAAPAAVSRAASPLGDAATRRLKAESEQREAADRRRTARTERLTKSVCTGCGGPVVPFDPSGGRAAREAVSGGARKPPR